MDKKRSLTYFISDLHLGAAGTDVHAAERKVCRFLRQIEPTARRLYLMGDILDYWFEYRYAVPRGFTRFFGTLADLSDSGVEITWYIGNHDIWIFDYLPSELGIRVVDGIKIENIDGKTFFLNHGDGVGHRKRSFLFIRSLFRNKVCQKLYSGIHPRWTIPFALGWSHGSRKHPDPEYASFNPNTDPLVSFARDYSASHPEIDYFIFGHRHVDADISLHDGARIIILGDWISLDTYAVFDGKNIRLLRYDGQIPSI